MYVQYICGSLCVTHLTGSNTFLILLKYHKVLSRHLPFASTRFRRTEYFYCSFGDHIKLIQFIIIHAIVIDHAYSPSHPQPVNAPQIQCCVLSLLLVSWAGTEPSMRGVERSRRTHTLADLNNKGLKFNCNFAQSGLQ